MLRQGVVHIFKLEEEFKLFEHPLQEREAGALRGFLSSRCGSSP
jgi:hypothetical protein